MRTWIEVFGEGEILNGYRNDEQAFFVKAPLGRAELDTFLRDDCSCSYDRPRCTFHAGMFFTVDKEVGVAA